MERKITFDDLIGKIPNKYELAMVVGKRARDLGFQTTAKNGEKETTIKRCFKEILAGNLVVGDIEEMAAEEKLLEENLDVMD
ncbi:MAG: DNA-directed RNA polymerase subunit omega [Fusobacteriaceae bacterium]